MNSEALTIKIASSADAGLIADLSRKTFYDSFAPVNTPENMDKFMSQQFTWEKLIAEATAPEHIFLLAYLSTEPVGYACLRNSKNPKELQDLPSIEISRIYATQQVIGKGVGKALMQGCIDIAKEKKLTVIWLGVWEHNQHAINFYSKWGFEKFSQHKFMLGDDEQTDWLMKKML